MVAAAFNTLKFANRLKSAGVSPAQAEAEAEILSEVFELNLQGLVTKEDLHHEMSGLRHEMSNLRKDMDLKIDKLDFKIEKLDAKLERLELHMIVKLTVIMGVLLSAAVAFSKLL